MYDTLSYKQLFNEIDTLNTSAYSFLYNNDFEGFQGIINDFIASGITESNNFDIARAAYRYAQTSFSVNGFLLGSEAEKLIDDYIFHHFSMGRTTGDIKADNFFPTFAYMCQHIETSKWGTLDLSPEEIEQEKEERKANRLLEKRAIAFNEYIKLYHNLYTIEETNTSIFSMYPLIADVSAYQQSYVDNVIKLAEARSKINLTFKFTCKQLDAASMKGKTQKEKIDILTQHLPNIYLDKNNSIKNNAIEDYLTFDNNDQKLLVSNYIQGKGIDRKNWKKYCKATFPNNIFFYLQLAFYLAIPSSSEIEKFMNHHGYSIKSDMTFFHNIGNYNVMYKDLCRWIDAGLDYNLINEFLGYPLEIKEQRKTKTI